MPMGTFLAELKRRNVYRVGAAYVVVAWVLLQLAANVAPILDLPPWVARATLLLLVMGFPVALLLAWTRELAPASGAVRTPNALPDWVLVGALVVVIALVSYQQLAELPASQQTSIPGSKRRARPPYRPQPPSRLPYCPSPTSQGDASQDFFSDGMTEEIVTALAKIPDLRVVARGSASQFKGERKDMRAVGQALGATHLIEGSVRKAGTRLRIAAQLVKADDGVNIWASSYDRELTDVFAIQEEIATAIAGALRMPLGLKAGEQLVNNRAIDPDSYQQVLRAKAVLQQGNAAYAEALAILEPLVARNPNYAPAWVKLAFAYARAINSGTQNGSVAEAKQVRDTYTPKMEAAARRAIELDPTSVEAILFQAYLRTGPRKLAIIEDASVKGLFLDPNHPDALNFHSSMLLMLGRIKDGLAMKQQLHELEPFIPLYDGNLADALWVDGQTEAAIAKYRENLDGSAQEQAPVSP